MEPYEVIDEGNVRGEIFYDHDAESPRQFMDGWLGHMVCGHKRYNLGDEQLKESDFSSWGEIENYLIEERGAKVILPLSIYDHSGITMSVGHCRGWDTMPVGYIYATEKTILEQCGKDYDIAKVEEILRDEVKIYDYYLTGEVFGFRVSRKEHITEKCPHCNGVLNENDEYVEVDSCWGFYGMNDVKDALKEAMAYAGKTCEEKS